MNTKSASRTISVRPAHIAVGDRFTWENRDGVAAKVTILSIDVVVRDQAGQLIARIPRTTLAVDVERNS